MIRPDYHIERDNRTYLIEPRERSKKDGPWAGQCWAGGFPEDRSGLGGTARFSKIGAVVRNLTQVQNISLDRILLGLVPSVFVQRGRAALSIKKKCRRFRRRSCPG
jgi:hypothetical protein